MKRQGQKIARQFFALFMAVLMIAGCLPTIGAAASSNQPGTVTPYTGDPVPQETLDALSEALWKDVPKKDIQLDPDEVVRAVVVLDSDTVYQRTGKLEYTASVQSAEQQLLRQDAEVEKSVERVAGSKIVNRTTLMTNTMSVDVPRSAFAELEKLPGVKAVYESGRVELSMVSAKDIADVISVWEDLGYDGEGVVVAVVDTGVNYLHPDMRLDDGVTTKFTEQEWKDKIASLGYGTYYSEKVPFGHNYFRGDDNVLPSDAANHGFHVSGIIAANGDEEKGGIKGVAPNAQVLGMAVYDYDGTGGLTDDIGKAIEDAIKLGADIVNMSLGRANGFYNSSFDLLEQEVEIASANGILCCVAAGNEGLSSTLTTDGQDLLNHLDQIDLATVASPALAESALAVASFNNNGGIKSFVDLNGEHIQFYDFVNRGFDLEGEFEVVDCGAMPSNQELEGKIAVIQRGGQTFTEKAAAAAKLGAAAVIIYNNAETDEVPDSVACDDQGIPTIAVSGNAGAKILAMEKVTDPKSTKELVAAEAPYEASYYSSWGGTSLTIKPEISAPGGAITSTIQGDSYGLMSGTSMASPFTAGVEALLLQYVKETWPGLTGKELVQRMKTLTMNTATPQMDITHYDEDDEVIYSVRMQGAGMINARDAMNTSVIATYNGQPKIELKEVGANTSFTVTLQNLGDTDATYTMTPGTLYTNYTDPETKEYYMQPIGGEVSIQYDRGTVTVPAGGSVDVKVTVYFTSYMQFDLEDNSFVEGYVQFHGDGCQDLSLPLLAFYGTWGREQIIDDPAYTGKATIMTKGGAEDGTSVLFSDGVAAGFRTIGGVDPDYISFCPGADGLYLNLALLRAAKEIKVDVLDANGNVIRTTAHLDDVARPSLETLLSNFGYSALNSATSPVGWDGTIYDPTTGELVPVEDGQYYIRVGARVDLEGSNWQYTTFPAMADSVPPTVSGRVIEKDGNFYAVFTMEDNFAMRDIATFTVNGKTIGMATFWPRGNCTYDTDTGEYYFQLPTTSIQRGRNNVVLYFSDMARNETPLAMTFDYVEDVDEVTVITDFDNPKVVDGKVLVEGFVPTDDYTVSVNGTSVPLNVNYFGALVEVSATDITPITVEAWDGSGNKVFDETYDCAADLVPPVITITPDPEYVNERENDYDLWILNGNYDSVPVYIKVTDDRQLNMDGKATWYRTFEHNGVNDNHALTELEYFEDEEYYKLEMKQSFGDAYTVTVQATDAAGNSTQATCDVYKSDYVPFPEVSGTFDESKVEYSDALASMVGMDAYIIKEFPVDFTMKFRVFGDADVKWGDGTEATSYFACMIQDMMTGDYAALNMVPVTENLCEYDEETGEYTFTYTIENDGGAALGVVMIGGTVVDTNNHAANLTCVAGTPGLGAMLGMSVDDSDVGNGYPVVLPGDASNPSDVAFEVSNVAVLSGVSDEMLNPDGTFTLRGAILGDYTSFTINGQEVTVKDNSWNFNIPIFPGRNRVIFTVLNGDKVELNFAYNIFYLNPARITVDLPDPDELGDYVVHSPVFNVKGSAELDALYSDILVNGDIVLSSTDSLLDHGTVEFQHKIELIPGENIVTVTVIDLLGFETTLKFTVVYVPFEDVKEGDYFYDAVQWATDNAVTSGTSRETFTPYADCTRAQAVTFLWRAAGCPAPESTENPFTDVKADDFYYDAVLWAVENGITLGITDTTFDPNGPCTRGQVVTFLWRFAGEPVCEAENPFIDAAAGDYYYNAVLWAVENGITQGLTETTFAPNDHCNRAQAVTFLWRLLGESVG